MDFVQLPFQAGVGVAVAFAMGLLLLALNPKDRAGLRNTLLLAFTLALTLVASISLHTYGSVRGANVMLAISVVGIGAVIIRLASSLLFQLLLPRLRLDLPRIVEDLCVTGLVVAWLLYWLAGAGRRHASQPCRFDAVLLDSLEPPRLEWIRGAFDAG